jgi:hypothetical protein
MKRVVTSGDLRQGAMRPADLLAAYVAHAQADIARLRLLEDARERGCPACGGTGVFEFERLGFHYHRCGTCQTLFVTPLPGEDRLQRYHREGEADRFRREHVLPTTADVRARHGGYPRAHWVQAVVTARLGSPITVAHFGEDSSGLLEPLRAALSVVEWSDAAEVPSSMAVDAIVAFDVLERSRDLSAVLRRCRRALRARGLLFVTTISGEGFEIRMLGGHTASLVPPVHLHLLSREGWQRVLTREGFQVVEYSTPGELDVQAVAEACRRHGIRLSPILDDLVCREDEQVGRAFQEVLQQASLSSHVQLIAEAHEGA